MSKPKVWLSYDESKQLAAEIDAAVSKAVARWRRTHHVEVVEHETCLALARAAVRYGFDILPAAASRSIDRLEVAIAEAEAKHARSVIAGSRPADPPEDLLDLSVGPTTLPIDPLGATDDGDYGRPLELGPAGGMSPPRKAGPGEVTQPLSRRARGNLAPPAWAPLPPAPAIARTKSQELSDRARAAVPVVILGIDDPFVYAMALLEVKTILDEVARTTGVSSSDASATQIAAESIDEYLSKEGFAVRKIHRPTPTQVEIVVVRR